MTYRQAIAWIAENRYDAISQTDADLADLDVVHMASDCFGVNIEIVVHDVQIAIRSRRVTVAAVRKAAAV